MVKGERVDRFGFSWLGVAFVVTLFVPDIVWARNRPGGPEPQATSSMALGLERLGQILVCAALITCEPLQIGAFDPASWLVVGAAALMAAYEVWWAKYFRKHRNEPGFFGGSLYIPIGGALLSITSLLLLGIYARDLLSIAAVAVLGIGRVAVDQEHRKQARMHREEEEDLQRRL